ncbi:hypothetical protein L2E82_38941 [Cichorium intybus]|uniref:Uncharacterized protein n=1 Tax=Cichorium intybus TaxID=13427 RepID=A0ACB9AH37_CICIN|nr:hypothetical protein L2E82_38941 [Cichorium intybus]
MHTVLCLVGVLKLEATKFKPKEVIEYVLQTAAASLKKMLVLDGHVADDVPLEINGDVLRIRQILTNLISSECEKKQRNKETVMSKKWWLIMDYPTKVMAR